MSHPTLQSNGLFVPKALLLDERLTPLERNTWMTLRSFADDDGTVTTSQESLRGFLSSAPGSQKAASETVSRAVLCLQLSGWLAHIAYQRNPRTGLPMASRYAVRIEPLAFVEACLADGDYPLLIERALEHASATARQLAQVILDEALRHPDQLARLPAELREQVARLHQQAHGEGHDGPDDSDGGSTDVDATDTDIPKSTPATPETVRTVESNVFKEVRQYRSPQSEAQASRLNVPARFQRLEPDQQRYLVGRLQALRPEQRQAVLDEWNVRCAAGYVRDAAAYLYGLIKKALQGTFRLWAARKSAPTTPAVERAAAPPPAMPRQPACTPCSAPASVPVPAMQTAPKRQIASLEVAHAHLDRLRALLDMKPRAESQHARSAELGRPHPT